MTRTPPGAPARSRSSRACGSPPRWTNPEPPLALVPRSCACRSRSSTEPPTASSPCRDAAELHAAAPDPKLLTRRGRHGSRLRPSSRSARIGDADHVGGRPRLVRLTSRRGHSTVVAARSGPPPPGEADEPGAGVHDHHRRRTQPTNARRGLGELGARPAPAASPRLRATSACSAATWSARAEPRDRAGSAPTMRSSAASSPSAGRSACAPPSAELEQRVEAEPRARPSRRCSGTRPLRTRWSSVGHDRDEAHPRDRRRGAAASTSSSVAAPSRAHRRGEHDERLRARGGRGVDDAHRSRPTGPRATADRGFVGAAHRRRDRQHARRRRSCAAVA